MVEATGFTCCIGVGDNKLRAKLATGFAKAPKGALPGDAPGVFTAHGRHLVDADGGPTAGGVVGHRQSRTAERLAALGIGTVASWRTPTPSS